MQLTYARTDLSTELHWVDKDVNRSRESTATSKRSRMPSNVDIARLRIFPLSMDSPAARISAAPIDFTWRLDL